MVVHVGWDNYVVAGIKMRDVWSAGVVGSCGEMQNAEMDAMIGKKVCAVCGAIAYWLHRLAYLLPPDKQEVMAGKGCGWVRNYRTWKKQM